VLTAQVPADLAQPDTATVVTLRDDSITILARMKILDADQVYAASGGPRRRTSSARRGTSSARMAIGCSAGSPGRGTRCESSGRRGAIATP
jgi:hypothetical protein